MKKILFITNAMPYPGVSGGTRNTKLMLENFIKQGYSITLLFLLLPGYNENELQEFKTLYPNLNIYYFLNTNNRRSISNMFKSMLSFIPLNVFRNKCKELNSFIINYLENKETNIIFCDHLEMFQFIPKKFHYKTILREHNAEYQIWRRYAKDIKNPLIKAGVFFESWRIKKYELSACNKVKFVWAAPEDIKSITPVITDKYRVSHIIGDDTMLSLPELNKPQDGFHILFIGTLTWEANINGVNWFIKECLPKILKKYPETVFDICGKYKDSFSPNNTKNIVYHGFVDDLEEYFQKATVFICPLLFGSGMKIKIIEALYRGIPLVTTPIGAESIELENGKNSFVTNNSSEFADDVMKLFEKKDLWNSFKDNARITAKQYYTWEQEMENFNEMVNNL